MMNTDVWSFIQIWLKSLNEINQDANYGIHIYRALQSMCPWTLEVWSNYWRLFPDLVCVTLQWTTAQIICSDCRLSWGSRLMLDFRWLRHFFRRCSRCDFHLLQRLNPAPCGDALPLPVAPPLQRSPESTFGPGCSSFQRLIQKQFTWQGFCGISEKVFFFQFSSFFKSHSSTCCQLPFNYLSKQLRKFTVTMSGIRSTKTFFINSKTLEFLDLVNDQTAPER